jgi:hypothetical protein
MFRFGELCLRWRSKALSSFCCFARGGGANTSCSTSCFFLLDLCYSIEYCPGLFDLTLRSAKFTRLHACAQKSSSVGRNIFIANSRGSATVHTGIANRFDYQTLLTTSLFSCSQSLSHSPSHSILPLADRPHPRAPVPPFQDRSSTPCPNKPHKQWHTARTSQQA